MSDRCTGVQQHIKQVTPQALNMHCYTHCLNLVLVYMTKTVPQASEFFALMETLYGKPTQTLRHTLDL